MTVNAVIDAKSHSLINEWITLEMENSARLVGNNIRCILCVNGVITSCIVIYIYSLNSTPVAKAIDALYVSKQVILEDYSERLKKVKPNHFDVFFNLYVAGGIKNMNKARNIFTEQMAVLAKSNASYTGGELNRHF